MKYGVLLAFSMLMPFSALAQTTTTISDANDPTKERYCDPAINADVMAKIRGYERKIEALSPTDPQRLNFVQKINQAGKKLKCSYRTIQDQ